MLIMLTEDVGTSVQFLPLDRLAREQQTWEQFWRWVGQRRWWTLGAVAKNGLKEDKQQSSSDEDNSDDESDDDETPAEDGAADKGIKEGPQVMNRLRNVKWNGSGAASLMLRDGSLGRVA